MPLTVRWFLRIIRVRMRESMIERDKMLLEIFEPISREGQTDEDRLFDYNLTMLREMGYDILRYDPMADAPLYEEERIQSRLDAFQMPYYFLNGEFRLAGTYDLNRLKIGKKKDCSRCTGCAGKKNSCGGCSGCPKKIDCHKCK